MQKIERQPRQFNPLKIPQALQAALPFASKPKLQKKRKQPLLETKRAVVMEPHERHVTTLLNQLNLIRNEKVFLCFPLSQAYICPNLEFHALLPSLLMNLYA